MAIGSQQSWQASTWVAISRDSPACVEVPILKVRLAHATVPKSAPMPAVTAIASAPQNVTRIAPTVTPAPPARAANPPRSVRNTNEVPETRGIIADSGAIAVTRRGIAAPTAKLPADANAA